MKRFSILLISCFWFLQIPGFSFAESSSELLASPDEDTYIDIIFNFEEKLQDLDLRQETLSDRVDRNANDLRETESRMASIMELLVDKMEELSQENQDLRDRIAVRGCGF